VSSLPILRRRSGLVRSATLQRLQFAERLLNRVEVGQVFRQIKQFRVGGFHSFLNSDTFVGWQVVHDDYVAAPERWCAQALF
jgi:hypothetical protein